MNAWGRICWLMEDRLSRTSRRRGATYLHSESMSNEGWFEVSLASLKPRARKVRKLSCVDLRGVRSRASGEG